MDIKFEAWGWHGELVPSRVTLVRLMTEPQLECRLRGWFSCKATAKWSRLTHYSLLKRADSLRRARFQLQRPRPLCGSRPPTLDILIPWSRLSLTTGEPQVTEDNSHCQSRTAVLTYLSTPRLKWLHRSDGRPAAHSLSKARMHDIHEATLPNLTYSSPARRLCVHHRS